METRGVDAVNRLKHKYGTVDELCHRLHVSPNEGTLLVYLLNHYSYSEKTSTHSVLIDVISKYKSLNYCIALIGTHVFRIKCLLVISINN